MPDFKIKKAAPINSLYMLKLFVSGNPHHNITNAIGSNNFYGIF
jgi:hypothetical protein